MARRPNIPEDLAQFAKNAVRHADDAHELRKAQAILLPALFRLDLVATGMAIGRSKASVCRLQAEFRAECAGAHIAPKKRGGRRRQNMSLEQEAQLLEPFFRKAREGHRLVVAEIRKAYETAIGKNVPASTIYRLLARHGWSRPRAKHSMDQD
jgi:transposase